MVLSDFPDGDDERSDGTRRGAALTMDIVGFLSQCTVAIYCDGRFAGTGFFVAPEEVLTCAHVVHGAEQIVVKGGVLLFDAPAKPATALLDPSDPKADFYPPPDCVLLRVDSAPADHPCVRLDRSPPQSTPSPDLLHVSAYTQGEYTPDQVTLTGATVRFEGRSLIDGVELFKFREGQIVGGFSGSPVLNLRTQSVCAMIDSTRDAGSALGGFGVPVREIAESLPGDLSERNARFHASDERWELLARSELELRLRGPESRRRMPLVPPSRELVWSPQRPITDLLRPRYAVVPFQFPATYRERLDAWLGAPSPVAVMIITGEGGFGKTRSALSACLVAEQAGWRAGMYAATPDQDQDIADLVGWPAPLVTVVDYAETSQAFVTSLLREAATRTDAGAPLRIILTVRQRMSRQRVIDLFTSEHAYEEVQDLLHGHEHIPLDDPVFATNRDILFGEAFDAFVRATGSSQTVRPLSSELELGWQRPLFVVAAALLSVVDAANAGSQTNLLSGGDILREIIDRHEMRYWNGSAASEELTLSGEEKKVAISVATLTNAQSSDEVERLLGAIPYLDQQSIDFRQRVARWLQRLYGDLDQTMLISSLEPDLLAETVIKEVVAKDPGLVTRVLDRASARQASQCLSILARMSVVDDGFRRIVLNTLLRRHDLFQLMDRKQDFVAMSRILGFEIGPQLAVVLGGGGLDRRDLADVMTEFRDMTNHATRLLAADEPHVYLPQLAKSLTESIAFYRNAGNRLALKRRSKEALEVFDQMKSLNIEYSEAERNSAVLALVVDHNARGVEAYSSGQFDLARSELGAAVDLLRSVTGPIDSGEAGNASIVHVNFSLVLDAIGGADRYAALDTVRAGIAVLDGVSGDAWTPHLAWARGLACEQEAELLLKAGRHRDAVASAAAALALYEQAEDSHPERRHRIGRSSRVEALGRIEMGERHAAFASAARALSIFEDLYALDPTDARRREFEVALDTMTKAFRSTAAGAGSAPDLEVIAWRRLGRGVDRDHEILARLLGERSVDLYHGGFVTEALLYAREAAREYASCSMTEHRVGNRAIVLRNTCVMLRALGHDNEAARVAREADRLDPAGRSEAPG